MFILFHFFIKKCVITLTNSQSKVTFGLLEEPLRDSMFQQSFRPTTQVKNISKLLVALAHPIFKLSI